MAIIDHAQTLILNGYQVIPIETTGIPLVNGFQTTMFGVDDAKQWKHDFKGAGLALVGGKNNVYALDFDIDNAPLAGKIKRAIIKKYPSTMVRRCNEPRFALLFRAASDLQKIKNGHSIGYKDGGGSLNQVELIGGKLMTLYGKHRDTGNPYRWSRELNPLKVTPSELPELTTNDIGKIFALFENNVPDEYISVHKKSFTSHQDESSDTFEDASPVRRLTEEQIDELLEVATGNHYKEWTDVGMALQAHYGSGIEGLRKWDNWSSNFDGYEKGLCRKKWGTFKADGGINLSIIAHRLELFKPDNPIQEFLDNNVYIEKGLRIGNLQAKPAEAILTIIEAKGKYSNKKVVIDTVTPGGKPTTKKVPIMTVWKEHEDRKDCYDTQYIPVPKQVVTGYIQNTERDYWNTYVPPELHVVSNNDLIHYFLEHVRYLFPDNDDDQWFFNWFAQLKQDPVHRFPVTPLHISTFQGTGRGWLTRLMTSMVGIQNMTKTNIKHMCKEDGFTNYLDSSVLCFLDEVYQHGGERYTVNDRMKTILSDDHQDINKKYGAQLTQTIYTRFFMSSNHIDAIVIDDLDRRIEPFINRQLPKSKNYYEKLVALLENKDFLNQVHTYLMNYQVDTSQLVVSRSTKARDTLIKATKSKTANAFFEFKNIIDDQLYHDKMLHRFIADYNSLHHPNEQGGYVNPKEIAALERDHVQTSELKMVHTKTGDRPLKVKTFTAQMIDTMDSKETAKRLLRAQRKLSFYIKQWNQTNESR